MTDEKTDQHDVTNEEMLLGARITRACLAIEEKHLVNQAQLNEQLKILFDMLYGLKVEDVNIDFARGAMAGCSCLMGNLQTGETILPNHTHAPDNPVKGT